MISPTTRLPTLDRARGRWPEILASLGVPKKFLTGRHGPCPFCGGTDRFRFTDHNDDGCWICNQCGKGNGVTFLVTHRRVSWAEACKAVDVHLANSGGEPLPKRKQTGVDPKVYANLWRSAVALSGECPASAYLQSRGITDIGPDLSYLRFHERVTYSHDGLRQDLSAMLALFLAPDASAMTLHMTFLDHQGRKADVPAVRLLARMSVPPGGAVRLGRPADTMGIAEGIETALSASKLFSVPVWSALNSGCLMKWEPPPIVRHVIVFGDADAKFGGQLAAYSLAHRLLLTKRFESITVRLPGEVGTDWNDVLMAEQF